MDELVEVIRNSLEGRIDFAGQFHAERLQTILLAGELRALLLDRTLLISILCSLWRA